MHHEVGERKSVRQKKQRLTWSLHLDDLSSQVTEDHGGEGTSQDSGDPFETFRSQNFVSGPGAEGLKNTTG